MAFYKYAQYLTQSNNSPFDTVTHPGYATPYSGIYRCKGCGENVASVQAHTYAAAKPPSAHRQSGHYSVEAYCFDASEGPWPFGSQLGDQRPNMQSAARTRRP